MGGCVKLWGLGIVGSGEGWYSDVTSVLRLVRKRGRNKDSDGPSGLSGFFVCPDSGFVVGFVTIRG